MSVVYHSVCLFALCLQYLGNSLQCFRNTSCLCQGSYVFLRFKSGNSRIQVTFVRALVNVELYFAVSIKCVNIYVMGVVEQFRPELTKGRKK